MADVVSQDLKDFSGRTNPVNPVKKSLGRIHARQLQSNPVGPTAQMLPAREN